MGEHENKGQKEALLPKAYIIVHSENVCSKKQVDLSYFNWIQLVFYNLRVLQSVGNL